MSHEIENEKAFFTQKPAWHGLGQVLTDAPSVQEAWKIAYPHELFKLDIQATIASDDGAIHTHEITDHKAIVRDDGKNIGIVGKGFELIQPYEAFEFFEPFIESGVATLEAGGSLSDGKRMWALAKVKGASADIIPGDPVHRYWLVFTGFDGSLSHGIQGTDVRVVCANTLAAAMSQGGLRFRHTKNLRTKIDQVQQEALKAQSEFQKDVEKFQHLAKKKMNRASQVRYVVDLFADGKDPDEMSTVKQNQASRVVELLDTQKGLELVPAVQGTAWQAYNAVTEYLTHEHGRSEDTRLNSQWFGSSASMNRKALSMALEA